MPEVIRESQRMDCNGIDLVNPIDRMPPGYYPYLFNARVIVEGRLDGRPGYTNLISIKDTPNSIRRLNDPSKAYAPSGYIYVGGGGPNLYAGVETNYIQVDYGYSGNPLSLIPFRPDQSPESWMYVYDQNRLAKVRPDGIVRPIGVSPPVTWPSAEYTTPAWVALNSGQSATGWAATGNVTLTGGTADRTAGSTPTITNIVYNSGTTGWCCIHPSDSNTAWMGERMEVIINSTETVVIREVHPATSATTILGITYDSGNTGMCSIVLTSNTPLTRNSLLSLNSGGEIVRVLEVILSPDGTSSSIRCSTGSTHSVSEAAQGLLTWYVYTVSNHAAGESIASHYIASTTTPVAAAWVNGNAYAMGAAILDTFNHVQQCITAGTSGSAAPPWNDIDGQTIDNTAVWQDMGVQSISGVLKFTGTVDASHAGGRVVDPANDYMHVSLYLTKPGAMVNLQLMVALDSTPNFSFTSPGNCYIWTISSAQILAQATASGWVEIVVPISQAARLGGNSALNLSNVSGLAIQITNNAECDLGVDWWYLFGTYGPTIIPNSPVGGVFTCRYRDSTTGAHSIPGPQTRYQLFPLREGVIITPPTTTQNAVDSIDLYYEGGSVTTPLYLATVPNQPATPQSYTDTLPDIFILEANQPPDLGAIQPWPIQQRPIIGTCNVVGTSLVVTSPLLSTQLLPTTVILISGVAYLLAGSPQSTTQAQLTQNAGVQTGVPFTIGSPTLYGQPLPFAFGALEGPFAPVVFGLGDPLNGNLLYFSNYSDADSSSDSNTLELSNPSNDLVSGAVWNGMAFCGSREEVFCIRYSYLTQIGASSNSSYQWFKIPAPSGMWSRWACCSTPIGVAYLGRDGIYIATDSGAINITDERLYPLFPHGGQSAGTVLNQGGNIILPVNMSSPTFLRISYCDEEIRFTYADVGNNVNTLIYQIYKKRWFLNNYANHITYHYLVETAANSSNPNNILTNDIIMMAVDTNQYMQSGGNTDAGVPINTLVLSPAMDTKDQRGQKLYVDTMTQASGTGQLGIAAFYDNAETFSPAINIQCMGSIQQYLYNISSLSQLALHRNIAVKYNWTGGPSGPQVMAWEYSGFSQPYLSSFFVTQYISLSFPGWKHMRRMYPAIISNNPILMTIVTQDGRAFGPFTIPSTNGQYRQLPQMLPHGLKDLAFLFQLDGQGNTFALFLNDFVIETKEWNEASFIKLAVFKS